MNAIEALGEARILPVITMYRVDDALAIGNALFAGGVRAIEITLRSPVGLPSIERVAGGTDLLVGAGTVLTVDDVARVAKAGAHFVVSPGFDPDVVAAAQQAGLAVLPGIATPTEAQRAMRAGLNNVKVFPAATLGGPQYLQQLGQPFSNLGFLPSGGITLETAADYLAVPGVLAVSGSWMVPAAAIHAADHALIRRLTAQTFERIDASR